MPTAPPAYNAETANLDPSIMSFLSSHRLHWGEHDALTGHFSTHLDMHVHDLPLHPTARALQSNATSAAENIAPPDIRSTDELLPDVPGP
jgi:hypothetical protein